MHGPHTGEAGSDWRLGPGPYRFSGPPSQCVGELVLINLSDNKVKVHALDAVPAGRSRRAANALPQTQLNLSARVPPHSEVRVRAVLQLDPHMPPGTYQAQVVSGEQKEALQIEVAEERELNVEPEELVLRGLAGQTLALPIVLTNDGNVPVAVDDLVKIWLEEREWIRRNLGRSLVESKEEDTYEDVANLLVHNLKASMVSPQGGVFEPLPEGAIAPGEQVTRTLSITVPDGVGGQMYLGFIEFDEFVIELQLYATAETNVEARR